LLSLILAVATLLTPAVFLLAAGLPTGWLVLASATALLAIALAVHLPQALGGSGLFVAPALSGLAAALVSFSGASGFAALALAAAAGIALGLLSGLVECITSGLRATGVGLLWLALASALPTPTPADPVVAEALAAALLLVVLLLVLVCRAEAGPLAVSARMMARSWPQSVGAAVPVAAVRVAMGAIAGLAAGLAAFAWSAAAGLGGDPPGTILLALALVAAVLLAGGTLPGLFASCFLLLGVPDLIRLIVPALPLHWLEVAAALVAVGLLGPGSAPLLGRLAAFGHRLPEPRT
jgi:hypothetical protein